MVRTKGRADGSTSSWGLADSTTQTSRAARWRSISHRAAGKLDEAMRGPTSRTTLASSSWSKSAAAARRILRRRSVPESGRPRRAKTAALTA
ncbi:MAG TPA: hypothetical protein VHM89_01550 [Acidimicrobiales bacterium]|nr:hypothetical protein [Acidimicrobiales bacterium]